jgi:hypothetical protein
VGCGTWGAGAKPRGPRAPVGHGRRVARFHFAGVALMGAGRGTGRGEEGRSVGSGEGSAAFHGALVRARFVREHVVGAGAAAFGFG